MSREIADAIMDLIAEAQKSCTDALNLIPVYNYNLAEDTVGVGVVIMTRAIDRSPEDYDNLRKRIGQAMSSRITPPNNFYGNKRRHEFHRRDY